MIVSAGKKAYINGTLYRAGDEVPESCAKSMKKEHVDEFTANRINIQAEAEAKAKAEAEATKEKPVDPPAKKQAV